MHIKTQIAGKIMNEINDYLERKDSLDNILNLSQESTEKECLSVNKVENSEGYMTLLSEGSVLYQDGTIRLYLCKGTLKNWYDSIDETFEGYVSTGHRDLNSYPVREGYFRKNDLKLVQDDNGRYDLLVKPHVNTQLSNVKDIILQDELLQSHLSSYGITKILGMMILKNMQNSLLIMWNMAVILMYLSQIR